MVKLEKEKKRKVWFFAFVKLDETPSRLDWLNGWSWLQSNKQRKFNKTKQTTISTTTELDYLLLSASERNAVFSSFNTAILLLSAFFEWLFREQEHLKRENGNEMKKYLLLANQQSSKMAILHTECCFQWDLECLIKSNQIKSNQIKSNQIKSYFPISHSPYQCEYYQYFPEFEWVKEDLNNYYHNTIHISFQFTFHD